MRGQADVPSREAVDFLRSIQAYHAGGADNITTRPASRRSHYAKANAFQLRDAIFLSKFRSLGLDLAEFEPIRNSHFTEYEDLVSAVLLWRASRIVMEAFKFLEMVLPSGVALGTLPLEGVNARVFSSPIGTPVIAINSALISFLYSMAKSVSLCLPLTTLPDGSVSLSSEEHPRIRNVEHTDDFAARLADYLCSGYSGDAFENVVEYVDTPAFVFASELFFYSLVFVISHEFAHVAIGLPENQGSHPSVTSVDLEAPQSWKTEFYADEIALVVFRYLMISSGDPREFMFGVVGAKFFFYCKEIVEYLKGKPEVATHPPLELRKRRINVLLMSPDPLPEPVSSYINSYANMLTTSLEELVDQTMPKIISYSAALLDGQASATDWLAELKSRVAANS